METTGNIAPSTKDGRRALGRTLDQASVGAHDAIDKVSDATRPVVERLASGAHQAVDKIASAAGQAADTLSVRGEQLKNAQAKALEQARGYVRDRPVTALGIAVAAGFVLSRLLRPDVMAPVEKLVAQMWPGATVVPEMSTGATDGLYVRNVGIPVYGVAGIFERIDDVRAHGRDERVGVKAFHDAAEYWYRLVRELRPSGDLVI